MVLLLFRPEDATSDRDIYMTSLKVLTENQKPLISGIFVGNFYAAQLGVSQKAKLELHSIKKLCDFFIQSDYRGGGVILIWAVWEKPTCNSLSTVVCRSATLFSCFLCTDAKMSSIFFSSCTHETEAVRAADRLQPWRRAFIWLHRGSLWADM